MLNASKAQEGVGKLAGYFYDINDEETASFSTLTYGLRFTGEASSPYDDTTKLWVQLKKGAGYNFP